MGYTVDIIECSLTAKSVEEAKKIIEEFEREGVFEIDEEGHIRPTDWSFNWSSDEYLFFAALSRVAEGYIAFRGENGEIWKIELKDGEIIDYTAEIVYRKTGSARIHEDFFKKKMVANERYVAAVTEFDTVIAYDRKHRQWLNIRLYGSLADLEILEAIIRGEDLSLQSEEQWSTKAWLDRETIEEFARKVLSSDIDQKIKMR